MKEFELKYGCNPNQKPARIFMNDGTELPIKILNGRPGYINFLDALNSWQLVMLGRWRFARTYTVSAVGWVGPASSSALRTAIF